MATEVLVNSYVKLVQEKLDKIISKHFDRTVNMFSKNHPFFFVSVSN